MIHDVEWQRSVIQHQSILEIGERYYEPIRRTFRKPHIDQPRLKKEFLLSLSVKACKVILGYEAVVPSAPVLGEFTSSRSFLGSKVPRTTLIERAQAAPTAHKVMAESQAKSRLKRGPKINHQRCRATRIHPGTKNEYGARG